MDQASDDLKMLNQYEFGLCLFTPIKIKIIILEIIIVFANVNSKILFD